MEGALRASEPRGHGMKSRWIRSMKLRNKKRHGALRTLSLRFGMMGLGALINAEVGLRRFFPRIVACHHATE